MNNDSPLSDRPKRGYSIDGFATNRRQRVIRPAFSKVPSANNLQPANRVVGSRNMRNVNKGEAIAKQPGVTWAPKLQDPADVELSRKTSRRRKKRDDKKDHSLKKARWKKIVKRVVLVLVVIGVIVGGYLGYKFAHNLDKVFGGNIFSNAASLFETATLKGESSGRVNILLAGDSSDDPGHQGADLTDSILVLSVNTKDHTAFLLSIPRDLWVNIPGIATQLGVSPDQKINSANEVTNFSSPGYPSGGMGQLQKIVTSDLGIPIDYYALSDYDAFKQAVDAVGGVKITIQSPDPRGLYDPNVSLKLPNGIVNLTGQAALNLARARGDGPGSYGFPNSDFDRTEHQRQIFTAIVQKASSLGFLDNPIKVGDLFDAFGNNVKTNLNLKDALALVKITKGINLNNIKSYSYCSTLDIGQDGCTTPILTDYTDPASGQESLVPTAGLFNFSQLQLYYEQLTSNNPIVKEAATTVILNGGNTTGLAGAYQKYLVPQGIAVTSVADASSNYATTEIMDNSGGNDPAAKQLLEKTFGTDVIANNPAINTTGADFVVLIGANQGNPPN